MQFNLKQMVKKGSWNIGGWKIDTPLEKGILLALPFMLFPSFVSAFDGSGKGSSVLRRRNYSNDGYAEGLLAVKKEYGIEYARKMEQLYRNETAHFTSGGFQRSNTAGIVAITDTYPYGWSSLDKYLKANKLTQEDVFLVSENNGYTYVGFRDAYHGVRFTAWFLATVRSGNVYAWYGLSSKRQSFYKSRLDGISTPIVDEKE